MAPVGGAPPFCWVGILDGADWELVTDMTGYQRRPTWQVELVCQKNNVAARGSG